MASVKKTRDTLYNQCALTSIRTHTNSDDACAHAHEHVLKEVVGCRVYNMSTSAILPQLTSLS